MGIPSKVAKALFAPPVHLDVRSYVPVGESLTQANFQDAFEAAYADALVKAAADAAPFLGAQYNVKPRYQVFVPNGLWHLTRSIFIPSTPQSTPQTIQPGISGESTYGTGFLIDTNNFTTQNGGIIEGGGDNGDDYVWHLLLENFNIQLHGGVNNMDLDAIHMTLTFGLHIRNVDVINMVSASGRMTTGYAVKLLDVGTASNNQYPLIENCRFQSCTGGVWAYDCLPLRMINVYCKQNLFCDVWHDRSVVSFSGGSVESAGAGSGAPYHNQSGKGGGRIITGWSTNHGSGTGASIGVASGDVTTVTGLSGMSTSDRYRWLYLEKSTNAYDGSDKVSGYYLITDILSTSSVTIRKGSTHSSTSSLIWSTHTGGGFIELDGMIYHEAPVYAGVGMYTNNDGAGAVRMRNCVWGNTDFAIETLSASDRAAPTVEISGGIQASALVKARNCPSIIALEGYADQIGDLDETSREGLIARGRAVARSGVNGYLPISTPSFVFSPASMPSGRARTMCRMAGAVALWDARVSSSFSKSGADITSWTDLIGGFTATLANAAKFPQYSASDAKFNNQPSVTFTGGSAANTCGLTVTIPQATWGSSPHQPCFVAVVATPAAAELAADVFSGVALVTPAATTLNLQLLVNYGVGPKYIGGLYPIGDTQFLTQTPDTNAHVFIQGGGGTSGPRLSSEADTRTMSNFGNLPTTYHDGWTPADTIFQMQPKDVFSSTSTFSGVFFAIFPHGLGRDARDQLMDALCSEFGISR